jgi:hypothetical protein
MTTHDDHQRIRTVLNALHAAVMAARRCEINAKQAALDAELCHAATAHVSGVLADYFGDPRGEA